MRIRPRAKRTRPHEPVRYYPAGPVPRGAVKEWGPVEQVLAREWNCTEGAAHKRLFDAERRLRRMAEIAVHKGSTVRIRRVIAQLQNIVDAQEIPADIIELMKTAFAADQLEDHAEHQLLLASLGNPEQATAAELRRWLNGLLRQHETTWLQIRWGRARLEVLGETLT